MSAIQTDIWSDFDMYCPPDWYGGYKEGRLLAAGDAGRSLSEWFSGDWTGSTFRFSYADHDRRSRIQLASSTDRYWTRPVAARMTTRANRANRGRPYTIFVGPIIDAQPATPLAMEITLGDIVSAGMLADRHMVPFRQIKDGFLNQLDAVSERLDLEQPEPIIYGTHTRAPGAASDRTGFRIAPVYLGIETLGGFGPYHVWLVAGHACKDASRVYVDGVEVTDAAAWLSPGGLNWGAVFGPDNFTDKVSDTYGVDRRYTLIYGGVGTQPDADACALGEKVLTCDVLGVEDEGDATGDLIEDIYQQYKHFCVNFVARQGPASYQSGDWHTNPVYTLLDQAVEVVEAITFDEATAIGQDRYGGSPIAGLVGAAVIGARAGDRSSVKRWIADWNRSSGARFGINHFGQIRIALLHPTEAGRSASRLYTDAWDIVGGSFGTSLGWADRVNSLPFKGDYDFVSSNWMTASVATDAQTKIDYEGDTHGAVREYPFLPGLDQGLHLATLELRTRLHPPRVIVCNVPIGSPTTAAAYLDLGDYFKYIHFDAVSETREERLAQVVRHQVSGSARLVQIEAVDCEDLIGYDVEGSSGGSP